LISYYRYDFPEWNFSLYFLGIFPDDAALPEPGTEAAETFLWNMDGTCLELTHNHGTESDDNYQTNNGNVEPFRGFGHLAVATKDVYEACDELEQNGVQFQKKPNEGRMKGLAFAKDPDGYWIEIISQHSEVPVSKKFTLAQTMFRVKDPLKSLHFYRDLLGMTVVKESVHGAGTDWGFSLYFLAHLTDDEIISEPNGETRIVQNPYKPVIELTHNHGTENNPDFK
jgi:lactoylglutathione lyase